MDLLQVLLSRQGTTWSRWRSKALTRERVPNQALFSGRETVLVTIEFTNLRTRTGAPTKTDLEKLLVQHAFGAGQRRQLLGQQLAECRAVPSPNVQPTPYDDIVESS